MSVEDPSPFRQICKLPSEHLPSSLSSTVVGYWCAGNLGIDPEVAKQALAANNNNVAAAIEWCFDGSFALETMAAAVNSDGHDAWKHVRRKLHIEKVQGFSHHSEPAWQ